MTALPRHLSRRALAAGYACLVLCDDDGLVAGGIGAVADALAIERKNAWPAVAELKDAKVLRAFGRTSAQRLVVLVPYRKTAAQGQCRTCGAPGGGQCQACRSVSGRRDRAWQEEALRHAIHSTAAKVSAEGLALRIAARTGRQLVGEESDGKEGVADFLERLGVMPIGTAARLRRLRVANQGSAWDD